MYSDKQLTGIKFRSTKYFKKQWYNSSRHSSEWTGKYFISGGLTRNSSCEWGVNNQHISKNQQETKFQCPMICEGNQTYNQLGECPVCNMQLVTVGIDESKIHIE